MARGRGRWSRPFRSENEQRHMKNSHYCVCRIRQRGFNLGNNSDGRFVDAGRYSIILPLLIVIRNHLAAW